MDFLHLKNVSTKWQFFFRLRKKNRVRKKYMHYWLLAEGFHISSISNNMHKVKISFSSSIWIISIFYWMLAEPFFSVITCLHCLMCVHNFFLLLTKNEAFFLCTFTKSIPVKKIYYWESWYFAFCHSFVLTPLCERLGHKVNNRFCIEATKSSTSEVYNAIFDVKWILQLNITFGKIWRTCVWLSAAKMTVLRLIHLSILYFI